MDQLVQSRPASLALSEPIQVLAGTNFAHLPRMKNNSQSPVGYHLVLRSHYPLRPFTNREFCVRSWALLRSHFPMSYSAMFMPNHFHLLAQGTPSEMRDQLATVSRSLSRIAGKSLWQPMTDPQPIPDLLHLKRQIRYVHLNPCRKSLCFDPIEWEWSTHRDYLGAVAKPWPNTAVTLDRLGFGSSPRAQELFHSYVSGDPSVRVEGTPAPSLPKEPILVDVPSAAKAGASALRISQSDLAEKGRSRALLMRTFAYQLGAPKRRIAAFFDVAPQSIEPPSSSGIQEDIELARSLSLILSDTRLRKGAPF